MANVDATQGGSASAPFLSYCARGLRSGRPLPSWLPFGAGYVRLRHMDETEACRLACPVLVVWGEADTYLLRENGTGVERYCDASFEFVGVPDGCHDLCVNKAGLLAEAIASWHERSVRLALSPDEEGNTQSAD